MKIDCHFAPEPVDELALRDRTVVALDVLRASSTIITALGNGAREVIPALTVESAMKIAGNLGPDQAVLGGERNGRIIPGFDLGNSPAEYAGPKVQGKSIIFTSTNGTQAVVKARHSAELMIGAFINMSAVVSLVRERPRDFVVLCSGRNGGFSLEDTVCAGMLIARVTEKQDVSMSDSAVGAVTLFRKFGRGILKMMRNSDHGRFLEDAGFGADLRYCAAVDSVPIVPFLEGNVIRLRREPLSLPVNS